MIPKLIVTVFAVLSLMGLCLQIVSDYWLPMLLGSLFTALLVRLMR